MTFNPDRHHRRSIRLRGYDYRSAGVYFVTLCVEGRAYLFGNVIDGVMHENDFGRIVREEWERTAAIRPEVALDAFVVMPNHIHGLISITKQDTGEQGSAVPPEAGGQLMRAPRSLGALVAGFKAATTKRINVVRGTPGERVWQRNYYEHIVRTDQVLDRIRRYIDTNPMRWELDRENPDRSGEDGFDRWLEFSATAPSRPS